MKSNQQTEKSRKVKQWFKHVFLEHWPAKVLAVIAGVLIWLCIGYLF